MTETRIFISYARSDGETFATELRKRLATEIGEEQLWQDRARMQGGVGWWQQIEDALNKVEFMVLVATPNAMDSPIVKKEWRYARQQGVCVYPVQVPGRPIDFAKFPRWMRDSHFYNLDKEWDTFVNYLKNPCHAVKVPFMAPDLPTHFVERPAKFNELVARLLDGDRQNPVAITTALRGAGGFGKTTLASALCHDDDVQTAFDDGVLWVTLGENPDTLGGLTKLYAALTGDRPSFVDTEDAANHLSEKLAELDCLIVIDDVWNPAHLRPFLRGGERCARLITTRMMDVAMGAKAEMTEVDEMTADESVAMLVGGIDLTPEPRRHSSDPTGEGSKADGEMAIKPELKAALRKLAGRLGEWPLMLELANGALRKRMARGDTVEHALDYLNDLLDEEGAGAFDPRNAQERNQAIGASVGASLRLLEDDERERLCELAIFKDDIDIPITTIQQLWGTKGRQHERLCELLADLSLVKFDAENGLVRLHDVIREYLGKQLTDAKAIHEQLIDAWGDAYTLPDDFAWRWYAYHLIGAGQNERLRQLLLDFRWLQAKLDATDGNALLSDFESAVEAQTDDALRLLHSAVRLSLPTLEAEKRQLGTQLQGRLSAHKDKLKIRKFLQRIQYPIGTFISLEVPLNYSHTPAGGPLLCVLSGYANWVRGALQLKDGRLLSWSDDGNICVWSDDGVLIKTFNNNNDRVFGVVELNDGKLLLWPEYGSIQLRSSDGQLLRIFEEISGAITGTIELRDGRFLSWSAYGVPCIWDRDGTLITTLQGHTGQVRGVIELSDGNFLSYSDDRTLRLWYSDGQLLSVLKEHIGAVNGVVELSNGHLLSWSSDGTLRLWTATGSILYELQGHSREIRGAIELRNGRLLSWSDDKDLRLWKLDGSNLGVLDGHSQPVIGALELNNGQLLSWSFDSTLRLWDSNGKALRKLSGHSNSVSGVLELDDGQLLSWSFLETLRLWSADGIEIGSLQGHTGVINGVIKLGLNRLLSWSGDGTLRVWDTSETILSEPMAHTNSVSGLLELSEERLMSWSGDGTLCLWSIDGTLLQQLNEHTDVVNGGLELSDGRLLSWSDDGTLRIWSRDGGALHVLRGHIGSVTGGLELSDGRLVSWSGSSLDSTLRLWSADGVKLRTITGHAEGVGGVIELRNGRLLSWGGNGKIRLWNNDGIELRELKGHTKHVYFVSELTDGRLLSWSMDGTLRLWNNDGMLISTLLDPAVTAMRESELINHQIVLWYNELVVRLAYDTRMGRAFLRYHGSEYDGALALHNGGAVSWTHEGVLRLWSSEGTVFKELYGHKNAVFNVKELDARRLISWSEDGTLRVWDLVSNNQVAAFYGDAPICVCIVLKKEPLTVAAGDRAGRVMFLRLVE